MTRTRSTLALSVTAALAGSLLLSSCVAMGGASPSPSADAGAGSVVTTAPADATTVLASPDPVAAAIAASSALFERSPLVVVAPAGYDAAIAEGAEASERLHVPLLLSPAGDASPTATPSAESSSPESSSALADELARLEVRTVVIAGSGSFDPADPDIQVVPLADEPSLPDSARPEPAEPLTDTVALAEGAAETGAAAAPAATARAAGVAVTAITDPPERLLDSPELVDALRASDAPHVLFLGEDFARGADGATGSPETAAASAADWAVRVARSGAEVPGGGLGLFGEHRYVAIYGTPDAPVLGVLGEQGVDATIARAQQLASSYQPYSDRLVVPTLEIIATVAAGDAGDDGDYSNERDVSALEPYVQAAAAAGVAVVLDLQPGRTDFLTQAKLYQKLLEYPGVGLALDPEWRLAPDQVPLEQIGTVSRAEVESVADWLADLVAEKALPPKMFVLHQFRTSMVGDRASLDLSRPELEYLIHVDGQGAQPDKQSTWNALHENAPAGIAWGWKNFYDEDAPMLTPQETMTQVNPVPDFISYQ
ncbi:hypothetical protein [Herbiconiux solani]|uniref:hypothetical protein n=1 Tax=Herbiconiux solani TaxID=661329 RepID=UPI0012ED70CE|nr:hypothetical protein [Herbiconiux solani]